MFILKIMYGITAGPTSLEDNFQKGALLGQKAALNLWYIDTRPNSQNLIFSYIFIHIIQIALFSSEYLPFYLK